jgi:protein-tyrosine phosphatase
MNNAQAASRETPQRIELEGTVNVRDIGGYETKSGSRVRKGVFYRADNLGQLTPRGRDQALALGLDVVIDLRSDDEVERHPNVLAAETVPRYLRHDLIGEREPVIAKGDTIELRRLSERDESGAFRYPVERLITGYAMILDDRMETVRELFDTLSMVNGRPMMYHCVAGQDRTGLVTAFLLAIAGVEDETIAFDYGETAVYNIERFNREGNAARWGLPIRTEEDYRRQLCPPEAMRGTLDHLDRTYGGAVEYLLAAGVPESAIRHLEATLTNSVDDQKNAG